MKKTFKIFWVLTLSAAMTVCGGTAAAAENQGLTEANDGVFVVNVHNFETGEDDQLFYQEAGADTYAVNSVETTPSYCPPGAISAGAGAVRPPDAAIQALNNDWSSVNVNQHPYAAVVHMNVWFD